MPHRQDTVAVGFEDRFEGINQAFFETLSSNEKELFKATTIAELLLEEVKAAEKIHKDKSISRKVEQALKPLVSGINQYGAALDVISNSSSLFLCPVWGSMRVILHLASEFGEYFGKISAMLEQVGLHLNSLRRFPRLYPHNERLEAAMVDVYCIIFRFCTEARNVFKKVSGKKVCPKSMIGLRSGIKLVWKPFKSQFGDLRDDLSTAMDKVATEVDIAEKEEAHAERERADKERRAQASRWDKTEHTHQKLESFFDEQTIRKVDQWLDPVNFEINHGAAVKLRHQGTGNWFLRGEAFNDWLNQDKSFLWLHAIPGAGKTVLVSSIIEYLKENVKNKDVGLAYFYCDYKESKKQEPSKLLCTLLAQFARQHKVVFQRLQAFAQERFKENSASVPTHDELRSNFATFLDGAFKHIILVIDAIDESNMRACIVSDLKTFFKHCPFIKILVSSREELDITKAFKSFPHIRINQTDVADDIESFVKAEVAARIHGHELTIRRPGLQQTICERLVGRSEGMFQWVKCQIQVLCSLGTDKAILKALDQMPKDLAGTYARILQRLEHDVENVGRYQKLLRWLVRSTRSLTLDELAECIGIDFEEDNESMDFDSVETYPENLLKRCSSLVTVSDDGRVSLAHSTVKEFLVSETTRNDLSAFYVGVEEVEIELAQTCLTYLCYNDFIAGSITDEEALEETLSKYHFLEYASTAWGVHAHLSKGKEDNLLDLTTKLLRSPSEGRGNYEFWLQVYQNSKGAHHSHFSEVKPLFFAASFGLPNTLKSLLEDKENDLSRWTETEGDPIREAVAQGHTEVVKILVEHYEFSDETKLLQYLYIASSKGHDGIVRFLLDKGVDVDAVGGKQGTALQIAALEGHRDVVHLLLSKHPSTKVVSARFGTPLSAAAEKGHERTFQTLLNAGASINGRGGWYAYPLISAIVGQNDTIIQILLNKGANVNLTGGRHVCALMAAAGLGKLALVEKLISKGARVNDENDKGADALHAASCAGHLDVVHLLLENGADVNAKGGKHRNALNAASSEGFAQIVDLLLDAGADPAVFDSNYGNAVQAAARAGCGDIVRKLADRGCEVNAPGGTRGTALVGAASAGQACVVEVLFELGVPRGDTQDNSDALVAATSKDHEKVVEVLVSQGANLNRAGRLHASEWLPLQLAANKDKFGMLSILLRLGADPNAIGGFFGSVLMAAADTKKVNCQILEALIVAGANVDELVPPEKRSKYPAKWCRNSTALSAAASNQQYEAVQLLLNHGANPDLICGNYCTALHRASQSPGASDIIKLLITHGADVNLDAEPSKVEDYEDNYGCITALQCAARSGGEANIRLLVANGARLYVERDDSYFKSALHTAAYNGKAENVKALLELGSDVNLRGGTSGTCLQAAAMRGKTEIMAILLDADAEINEHHVGCYGSALIAAILNSNHDAVKLLLERGADPSLGAGLKSHFPIIAAASLSEDEEMVQLLIDAGADVNAQGGRWHTALQSAAVDGNVDTMRVLLDAGADMNAVGGIYGSALSAAYRRGWYFCTGLLWERGVSNKLRGGMMVTPLISALSGSCLTLIMFLIKEHHADPNEHSNNIWGSPLHYCIYHSRGDSDVLVDLFLEYGADPNGLGPAGLGGYYGTPLNAAAARNEPEIMEILLDEGADPNIRGNRQGWTALQLACLYNRPEAFNILLEHNPDVNAHGPYGTPLQAAAYSGAKHLVRKLLHRGADLKVCGQGRYGHSLQSAAIRAREDVVRFLIKHGADVHVKGGRFGTVLQAASVRCSKALVDFLIRKGCKIDERGGRYRTALQAACAARNRPVVRTLLEHKANVNIAGGRFGSALQAACVAGDLDLVRMLVEHGADINAEAGYYGSPLDGAACHGNIPILRYLIKEAGATRTTANRRHNHLNSQRFDWADRNIINAFNDKEHEVIFTAGAPDGHEEEEDEAEEDEDPPMNIDSIPIYNPTVPASSDSGSSTAFSPIESSADFFQSSTSASEYSESTKPETALQLGKKARRRLARKKSNKTPVVEEVKEVEPEQKEEDLSALSWLQVECGYGGDLNGPGR